MTTIGFIQRRRPFYVSFDCILYPPRGFDELDRCYQIDSTSDGEIGQSAGWNLLT
ncbi:hypothetical protein CONPUDRAFT_90435 [Coniophora puteana RWD-64-598 SS2]|uniref:Uncharacterized protein n=1 Tax=Coniophora puteana (strain RWD-64-598) TaxID=741705 RepID=A0A5M3MQW4_CONPW|nr:uncharacterized protein CONPUDRAFT_90435 [Coniophora puteana RWD-64-598 SS2]EIW81573.1 hypothetical protein CONPUDRAFT_90435 [Coniophora puteana RWD-64-598 SS2]